MLVLISHQKQCQFMKRKQLFPTTGKHGKTRIIFLENFRERVSHCETHTHFRFSFKCKLPRDSLFHKVRTGVKPKREHPRRGKHINKRNYQRWDLSWGWGYRRETEVKKGRILKLTHPIPFSGLQSGTLLLRLYEKPVKCCVCFRTYGAGPASLHGSRACRPRRCCWSVDHILSNEDTELLTSESHPSITPCQKPES